MVAGQADRGVAPAPARRRRRGRRRSRRGRRGTTSPRSRTPRSTSSTASNAWRLPCMSETIATRTVATVSPVSRLPRVRAAGPALLALVHGRSGGASADPSGAADRARRGGRGGVFQRRGDRAGDGDSRDLSWRWRWRGAPPSWRALAALCEARRGRHRARTRAIDGAAAGRGDGGRADGDPAADSSIARRRAIGRRAGHPVVAGLGSRPGRRRRRSRRGSRRAAGAAWSRSRGAIRATGGCPPPPAPRPSGRCSAALAPVVLAPLFNDFTPLPEGETRSDVLALAAAAGVEVGEVYSVDASRRTTGANAYVTGLGPTKRVVLFDTLLESYSARRDPGGGRPRASPRAPPGRAARRPVRGDRRARRPRSRSSG